MGILKPSAVERARMDELEAAINHLQSITVPDDVDPESVHEWRAANSRVAQLEEGLGLVHRLVARNRTF